MIQPIQWRIRGDERSPFEPFAGRRRLRVTIHCPNPGLLSPEDVSRLVLLRELAVLDSLRVVDTDPSAEWRLEVDTAPNEAGVARGRIVGPDGPTRFMAVHPRNWIEDAIRRIGVGSPTDPRTIDVAQQLPYFDAHADSGRDVFITSHPDLLNGVSAMSLFDGLKLIGLYLRSRSDFTIGALGGAYSRDLFYWVLCRQRLPAMWPYFSAAVARGQALHDQTEYLANTILDRCVRVLQARDEVGFRFYRPQSNAVRDETLYHFDYLTLLLSGALDAVARVAHRVYGIANPAVRYASFRNEAFLDALDGVGGHSLTQIVREPRFVEFATFLGALRNTVHSIGLRGMSVSRSGQMRVSSLAEVFENANSLVQAATALGQPGDLGVDQSLGTVALEPYTCAVRLSELGLQYVDQVVRATDVTRILPAGGPPVMLMSGPPEDEIFGSEIRRRIDALG